MSQEQGFDTSGACGIMTNAQRWTTPQSFVYLQRLKQKTI